MGQRLSSVKRVCGHFHKKNGARADMGSEDGCRESEIRALVDDRRSHQTPPSANPGHPTASSGSEGAVAVVCRLEYARIACTASCIERSVVG